MGFSDDILYLQFNKQWESSLRWFFFLWISFLYFWVFQSLFNKYLMVSIALSCFIFCIKNISLQHIFKMFFSANSVQEHVPLYCSPCWTYRLWWKRDGGIWTVRLLITTAGQVRTNRGFGWKASRYSKNDLRLVVEVLLLYAMLVLSTLC